MEAGGDDGDQEVTSGGEDIEEDEATWVSGTGADEERCI